MQFINIIFQIMQGNLDRCSVNSVNKTIKMKDGKHLKVFVEKLCALPKKIAQNLVMGLVAEVDIRKYITMV